MELGRLTLHEELDENNKGIYLKATTFQSQDEKYDDDSHSDFDDETMMLLVQKFRKRLKRFQRKEARDSTKKDKNPKDRLTCHQHGKEGHTKFQCLNFLKKADNNKRNSRDFK
ncbi:hypothetical protein Lal_00013514 [Lupinus albus]|nr:hypothetical protein Lal_00013514 [Lupinus albus]